MTLPSLLSPASLLSAKWAFTTRRVRRADVACLLDDVAAARSGDLVLGRVETIGSHRKIQLTTGRGSELYPGDRVVLCCGDRYAPDQFEGIATLDPGGADLLAGGGVLGAMRARNARISAPTRIVPLGLLGTGAGTPVNLDRHALADRAGTGRATVIGVVGASMNAGKTTAVASLVHGLSRAGHRVAAIKATGTGAFGDVNAYHDAGAGHVSDFVDAGMVSTYRQPLDRVASGADRLIAHAEAAGCTVIVVELADGLFQEETAGLLARPGFRRRFDGWLFAAPDAMSVAGGVRVLRERGLEPAAVTGMVSRSPLATAEAEAAARVTVVTREALLDPARALVLLRRMLDPQAGASLGASRAGLAA